MFLILLAVLLLVTLDAELAALPDEAILMEDQERRISDILDPILNFLISGLLLCFWNRALVWLSRFAIRNIFSLRFRRLFLDVLFLFTLLLFEFVDLSNNLLRFQLLGLSYFLSKILIYFEVLKLKFTCQQFFDLFVLYGLRNL